MLSAACLEARRRGAALFPVLSVDLVSRGLDLGRVLASPAVRLTALGQVSHVTTDGGWEPISYGSGAEEGTLETVRTAVAMADPRGELIRKLEAYDPRGSAARIDWAAAGLMDSDWSPLFRGVLEDWQSDGLVTRLLLKTDDTLFRAQIPASTFLRPVWSTAADSTIFATAMPLCLGIFDSYAVTARGMVPAINVRYDDILGFWWAVSVGHQRTIRRVYFDGVAQPDTIWTTRRGVYGPVTLTIIEITAGYQPEKGVVVSCDLEGPDATGGYASTSITSPVRQLRTVVEEYAYRPAPTGAYRGDHAIVDDTTWDTWEAWFAARGYESARRWGGDQTAETAAEVAQSYLDDHIETRIAFSESGALRFIVIDPDDLDPDDAAHFRIDVHNEAGRCVLEPVDAKEVYTHLRMPYMWSPAEGKFLGALEAHDVAALPVKVPIELPNRWTQGRYTLE